MDGVEAADETPVGLPFVRTGCCWKLSPVHTTQHKKTEIRIRRKDPQPSSHFELLPYRPFE